MSGTIRIGTCGWAHRHWRGLLYPPSLAPDGWLGHFAREFDCVDAGNHDLPARADLRRWRDTVPDGFSICLRVPREVTHLRRLARREPMLTGLGRAVEQLGSRAGPVIFELPSGWRCNAARLATFLEHLPRDQRHAFACHHPSWQEDEPLALLAAHGCAPLLHDQPDTAASEPGDVDFVVVRLHGDPGQTRGNYRAQALSAWASRARGWSRRGKDVYLLFADDAEGHAVKHARRLRNLLEGPDDSAGAAADGAAL